MVVNKETAVQSPRIKKLLRNLSPSNSGSAKKLEPSEKKNVSYKKKKSVDWHDIGGATRFVSRSVTSRIVQYRASLLHCNI